MITLDIVILILVGLGALKGYRRGFVVEIFSFVAFFIGLYLALELTIPVSVGLFGETSYFGIISVVVFIALFILLSLLIKAGAKALKNMIDTTLLGAVDNLAGALAGGIKWAFILSMIFWVFSSVGFDLASRYAPNAIVFPYILHIGPAIFEWLGQVIPMIRDFMDSMQNMPKEQYAYQETLIIK